MNASVTQDLFPCYRGRGTFGPEKFGFYYAFPLKTLLAKLRYPSLKQEMWRSHLVRARRTRAERLFDFVLPFRCEHC
jgi:hypothetical protein